MIYVDYREPEIMVEKLRSYGVAVRVQQLDVGDYVIGEGLVIERKTIDDFFRSIDSNRYYEQLYRLKDYRRPIVYITGMYPRRVPVRRRGNKLVPVDISRELRVHRVISYYSFGVPVIHVASDDELIKDILEYHKKSSKREPSLKPIKKSKRKELRDIRVEIIGCIPGIGRKTANYLADHYTIEQLVSMTEEELCSIPIGSRKLGKKGKTIYRVFR